MYKCFGILIGDHRTIGQFNLKINLRKILDSTLGKGLSRKRARPLSRALKGCHLVHDIILLIVFFSSEQIGRHTDDQRHASDVQGDVKVVIALDACLGRGG